MQSTLFHEMSSTKENFILYHEFVKSSQSHQYNSTEKSFCSLNKLHASAEFSKSRIH